MQRRALAGVLCGVLAVMACDGGSLDMPPPLPERCQAVELAAGLNSTCARMRDGTVTCWGANDFFQLGGARPDGSGSFEPVTVALGEPVSAVTTESGGSTCAHGADSWLCWGRIAPFTLPGAVELRRPTRIPFADMARIVEASAVICVLDDGGRIACMTGDSEHPEPKVLDDLGADNEDVLIVVGGAVCGLKSSGAVRCTTRTHRIHDHEVAGGFVSADGGWPLGLASNGDVWMLRAEEQKVATVPPGYDVIQGSGNRAAYCVQGEGLPPLCTRDPAWLGIDSPLAERIRAEPSALAVPGDVVDLSVGYGHMCAVTSKGEAYCWGENGAGQLGRDTGGAPVAEPQRVDFCP